MRIRIVAIGMLLLSAAAIVAGQNGNDLYQQGLARETAGDIQGAIQVFERIVRDSSSNRTLTARALVQLGRWSDLLGQDQARKYFERVIREFADQKEAAADARARLDALAKVAVSGVSPARRLAVDWADWTRRINDGRPTRDGRHWLRYNAGQRAFELVEIGSGNVRRLLSDGPNPPEERVACIELSTDGRRLAAVVLVGKPGLPSGPESPYERAELRVFEVGGRGTGRVLATWDAQALSRNWVAVQPFEWAPRNDRIWLFVKRSDQSAQIASVDLSGKLEVLKTLTWRDHTQAPSLSPDGRFLAYHDTTDRQTPPDLYIMATDGSREQRLEHPANDSKPMFLPDGSGIVFESSRRGPRDIWFQAVADGRPVGQPRLVIRNLGFGTAERFADTGSLFYFFAGSDVGTYTVPIDLDRSEGSIGIATRLAPVANELNSGAAFSPDGRHLAHFRANGARLVIRELTTGLEREIPFGAQLGSGSAAVDWCSSDTLIAAGYVGDYVAYRVNLKDASVQRLPIKPIPYPSPLCVGDGEEIIYIPLTPTNARDSIVRRSLASGKETTLFNGEVTALARSIDGERLAVVAVDSNTNVARLVTMSAAGGDISADLMTSSSLRPRGARRSYPLLEDVAWMPSGDRLLVVRGDEEALTKPVDTQTQPMPMQTPTWLWEVPLSGAAPRNLGLLPLPKVVGTFLGARSFTVQPGGKLLAFQSHEGFVEQTWAIDNLMQFIKAGGGW